MESLFSRAVRPRADHQNCPRAPFNIQRDVRSREAEKTPTPGCHQSGVSLACHSPETCLSSSMRCLSRTSDRSTAAIPGIYFKFDVRNSTIFSMSRESCLLRMGTYPKPAVAQRYDLRAALSEVRACGPAPSAHRCGSGEWGSDSGGIVNMCVSEPAERFVLGYTLSGEHGSYLHHYVDSPCNTGTCHHRVGNLRHQSV